MNYSAANYAIGGVLIIVAVFSFVFLHGPTSVFIGIGAAIVGVVFLLMGVQGPKQDSAPELGLPAFDGTPTDSDPWAQFDREHGLGETGYFDPNEPRRNT